MSTKNKAPKNVSGLVKQAKEFHQKQREAIKEFRNIEVLRLLLQGYQDQIEDIIECYVVEQTGTDLEDIYTAIRNKTNSIATLEESFPFIIREDQ